MVNGKSSIFFSVSTGPLANQAFAWATKFSFEAGSSNGVSICFWQDVNNRIKERTRHVLVFRKLCFILIKVYLFITLLNGIKTTPN